MSKGELRRGVVTPILTPFNDDGSVADELYFEQATWLLERIAGHLDSFDAVADYVKANQNATALDRLAAAAQAGQQAQANALYQLDGRQ